ncbi:hypothetical protein [Pseudoxanthomonas wuyuanensis]|uniref:TonB C terminal n=1 Tax=Pseudoxanthomonas wuyuanensis TaxID=1073196 RepID=A0A286CWX7_9GAMM|nr:hypothetical protein [Pseudoxanthomonas wuyuanensis]KAF1720887.1 hypothetical protein CSC75_09345 [Pseudoxanthomonas wuyuanensis]SOD50878.1 TonB C terminal [Pseudoxanthomonas wuyuanensis]
MVALWAIHPLQAQDAAHMPEGPAERMEQTQAYGQALRRAVQQVWTMPATLATGESCRVHIRQLPGGEVLDAEVQPDCVFDDAGRRSLQAAVLKASPLPYAGFEAVFQRNLVLNFVAGERR